MPGEALSRAATRRTLADSPLATIHRTTGEHERVLGSVTLAPFSDVWWAEEVVSCAYMQFVVRLPSLLSAPFSAPVPYPRQRTQTDD